MDNYDNWLSKVYDSFIFIVAILGTAISITDFFGWIDFIPVKDKYPNIIVLGISVLLFSSVLERRLHLLRIEKVLNLILNNFTFGIQYIDNTEEANLALKYAAKTAEEYIMTIGSKSKDEEYLNLIESKIRDGIIYYRLLTDDHITHELHKHLDAVIDLPGVTIKWVESEKYGTFITSEKLTVVALPSPYWNKFNAIKLPGDRHARLYNQYFMQVLHKGIPLRTHDAIECLCEEHGDGVVRNITEINKKLREQLNGSQIE